MSFSIQWQQHLADPGFRITTALANQIGLFSASNGYVYRHDPLTGENLCQTSLCAYGTLEIRLAAPVSGEVPVVGVNGNIVTMNPTSLEIQCCKSYLYCLDLQTRQILVSNGLSQYDFSEMRLALSDDNSVLFVGMNRYVIALPTPHLDKVLWCCDLSGVHKGDTSVAGGVGVVNAGCDGCVFRIESSSGKITHINDLGGIGKINDLRTHLWVGINGHGIALHPDDIATIFSKSLPESGCSITELAESGQAAYFANNGYVSCLYLNGKLIGSSQLPGLGEAEAGMSVNSATELIVEINGRCLVLTSPEYPQSYGPWMANMAAKIGPKPLRKVG